jgi:nicotinamidase-related amidase
MPAPKTLLALAGAASEPPPLHESAVLVIDAQNEYVEGPLALPGVRPALDRIAALLARARSAGAPVIHVRHLGRAGGLFDPDAPRGAIADPAKPSSGETVIGKKLPNAFADTELQAALAATGKRNIVVCGFMTHMCVGSTVRAALDLGYRSIVPAAATATRDLPDALTGAILPAAAIQSASLSALSDRFATIVDDAKRIPE